MSGAHATKLGPDFDFELKKKLFFIFRLIETNIFSFLEIKITLKSF